MRKILIGTVLVLFSVPALAQEILTEEVQTEVVQATDALTEMVPATDGDRWRYVAIGAGVLGGIWAANVLSAGILMPLVADGGIGIGGGVGGEGMGMGVGAGLFAGAETLVTLGGAIAGGYIGGWLYDG